MSRCDIISIVFCGGDPCSPNSRASIGGITLPSRIFKATSGQNCFHVALRLNKLFGDVPKSVNVSNNVSLFTRNKTNNRGSQGSIIILVNARCSIVRPQSTQALCFSQDTVAIQGFCWVKLRSGNW